MPSPEYKTICTLAVRGAIIKYNWYNKAPLAPCSRPNGAKLGDVAEHG